MIVLMLTVIILQVRSFSAMFMVVLTVPLGVAGVLGWACAMDKSRRRAKP
jgi:multidrug efflux pump subunit AcrB